MTELGLYGFAIILLVIMTVRAFVVGGALRSGGEYDALIADIPFTVAIVIFGVLAALRVIT